MRSRRFGRLGWDVSEIGCGMWGAGGWSGTDERELTIALDRAVSLGCNFFDTALAYGEGRSEQLLGDLLRRHPEQRLFVATKVPPKNRKWPGRAQTPADEAFSYTHIVSSTDTSLKNLGLASIDLQQLHVWDDSWTGATGWRRAVSELKAAGAIRGFGISVNRWEPANVLEALRTDLVDSVQVVYNVFDQSPEDELFPECERRGVAVIARVPFDEGSLTGTLSETSAWPDGDWRNIYFGGGNLELTLGRVNAVKEDASALGLSLPELALRFILSNPAVTTTIPGMRRLLHVEANLVASDRGTLDDDAVRRLRAHRWDRVPDARP